MAVLGKTTPAPEPDDVILAVDYGLRTTFLEAPQHFDPLGRRGTTKPVLLPGHSNDNKNSKCFRHVEQAVLAIVWFIPYSKHSKHSKPSSSIQDRKMRELTK